MCFEVQHIAVLRLPGPVSLCRSVNAFTLGSKDGAAGQCNKAELIIDDLQRLLGDTTVLIGMGGYLEGGGGSPHSHGAGCSSSSGACYWQGSSVTCKQKHWLCSAGTPMTLPGNTSCMQTRAQKVNQYMRGCRWMWLHQQQRASSSGFCMPDGCKANTSASNTSQTGKTADFHHWH